MSSSRTTASAARSRNHACATINAPRRSRGVGSVTLGPLVGISVHLGDYPRTKPRLGSAAELPYDPRPRPRRLQLTAGVGLANW